MSADSSTKCVERFNVQLPFIGVASSGFRMVAIAAPILFRAAPVACGDGPAGFKNASENDEKNTALQDWHAWVSGARGLSNLSTTLLAERIADVQELMYSVDHEELISASVTVSQLAARYTRNGHSIMRVICRVPPLAMRHRYRFLHSVAGRRLGPSLPESRATVRTGTRGTEIRPIHSNQSGAALA